MVASWGKAVIMKYLLWSETCDSNLSYTILRIALGMQALSVHMYMYITFLWFMYIYVGSLFKLEAGLFDICWPGGP